MIICCGEALIDMMPVATDLGEFLHPIAGGAVFNTAVGLGRLGVDVAMLTGLSSDLFGKQLARELEFSNVNIDLCVGFDRPTTLAFVEIEDGKARYHFYDENSAGRMLQSSNLPDIPDAASALFLGGISLCSEPAAETYAGLAEKCASQATVILDPNIRAGFIDDEIAYRARLQRIFAVADIVKVSDEDLEWLEPSPSTERQRVGKLRHEQMAGANNLVFVTRGDWGAVAYLPDNTWVEVAATKVTVVDTVGAGDAFNAGMLASLIQDTQLSKKSIKTVSAQVVESALQRGITVAGFTVSRAGANSPWASELL